MADVPVVGQQAADVIRAALTRWVPYGFRDDDGVWHEGVCQTEALAALERLVVERDAAERERAAFKDALEFERSLNESVVAPLRLRVRAADRALGAGHRFERAYQESLGATWTGPMQERLESLQAGFLDAYLAVQESRTCGCET